MKLFAPQQSRLVIINTNPFTDVVTLEYFIDPYFVSLIPRAVFVVTSGLMTGRITLYNLQSTHTSGSEFKQNSAYTNH